MKIVINVTKERQKPRRQGDHFWNSICHILCVFNEEAKDFESVEFVDFSVDEIEDILELIKNSVKNGSISFKGSSIICKQSDEKLHVVL